MINKLIEVISIKHSIVCCFTGWHSWGLRVCFHLLTVHRSRFVVFPTPSGETGVSVWQPSDPEQSWLSELGHCNPKELMHSHLPGLLHSLKTLKHLIWVLSSCGTHWWKAAIVFSRFSPAPTEITKNKTYTKSLSSPQSHWKYNKKQVWKYTRFEKWGRSSRQKSLLPPTNWRGITFSR